MLATEPHDAPDSHSRDVMRHTRLLYYGGISVMEDCVGVRERGREVTGGGGVEWVRA